MIKFHFGVLFCGKVREYLKQQQFLGRKIEFHEGRGWASRDFIIKGDPADVSHVGDTLMTWCRYLNSLESEK